MFHHTMDADRYARVISGFLVLVSIVLGAWFSPWWLMLSGFVGVGLIASGITGTCMLTELVQKCCTKGSPTAHSH